MQTKAFLRGDMVEVRSAAEIAATLDVEGKLDGLPFMPEMVPYCGRRLRVYRRADKICVEGYGLRRLRSTVLLETSRCDGSAHDACQRNCMILWKEAWLRPAPKAAKDEGAPIHEAAARDRLMATSVRQGDRYACQSTSLAQATTSLSRWSLAHLGLDVLRRELSAWGLFFIIGRTLINRLRRPFGLGDIGALVGPSAGRATDGLDLRPGEWVKIKSADEIRATLGPDGKHCGLSFEPEMSQYIGRIYQVEFPVERIVHEETGKMVRLKHTVALHDVVCEGKCTKNCPRANTLYWREAWLERAGSDENRAEIPARFPLQRETLLDRRRAHIETCASGVVGSSPTGRLGAAGHRSVGLKAPPKPNSTSARLKVRRS